MRRFLPAVAWLAGWTLLALFFSSQAFFVYRRPGFEPPPYSTFLVTSLVEWWGWALVGPAAVWLARRFPVTGGRSVAIHVVAGAALAAGKMWLNAAGRLAFLDYPWAVYPRDLHAGFVTYLLIVAGAHALAIYRRWRARELQTARLEGLLAEARLRALTVQLQPHFLFNTLNAIQSLLHDEPDAADRMISHLGDLLRSSLRVADAREVSLGEELEILTPYLEIQRTRHADRLRVSVDVEPEALRARVPVLLLQPLVENAIRHGLAPRAEPGTLAIRARRDNGALVVEVRDDGVGLSGETVEGVGLRNTRARLAELYGARGRLSLAAGEGGGTVARVEVPA